MTWLQWLQAAGGVSGVLALIGSAIALGRVLQKITDLEEKVKDIPTLVERVSYLFGHLDGQQDGEAQGQRARRNARRVRAVN